MANSAIALSGLLVCSGHHHLCNRPSHMLIWAEFYIIVGVVINFRHAMMIRNPPLQILGTPLVSVYVVRLVILRYLSSCLLECLLFVQNIRPT